MKMPSAQSSNSIRHHVSADRTSSAFGGFILLSLIFSLCFQLQAGTKRILVVGDSWAAFMTHPVAGEIFQHTLKAQGH
ncbi:MAG: hypothetical protein WCT12_35265, partial [Verrucomicrobiota bacterium]